MRTLPMLTLLVTLTLSAGCGTDRETSADDAKGTPSSGQSPSSAEDAALAKKTLLASVRRTTAEEVTWFRAETTLGGAPATVHEGFAKSGSWRATTSYASSGYDLEPTMRTLSAGGTLWMQMYAWPGDQKKCWLEISPTQAPLGELALMGAEPAYLGILPGLSGTGFEDGPGGNVVRARLGLVDALRLLAGKTLQTIGTPTFKGSLDGAVDVTVRVTGERVQELTMHGASLRTALEEVKMPLGDTAEDALDLLDITVNYSPRLGSTKVQAPSEDLIVPPGGTECHPGS